MKICKCNRCGKEIPEVNPLINMYAIKNYYPHFDITIIKGPHYDPNANVEHIDLCHDCSVELCNFIFDNADIGD